jgi:hypothetical protein
VRLVSSLCLAGGLLVALPTPAAGHAELVPWQLPPGETGGLLLMVTHGCGDEDEWISSEPLEEEPTLAVTVRVPLELDIVPLPVEGWSLTTETETDGTVQSATWRIDDPAGTTETVQLPIDVTVGDVPDGSEVWIPVVQECAGGDRLEWTLEGDLRGGDEVPAMRLVIRDEATTPATWAAAGVDEDAVAAARDAASPGPLQRIGLPGAALAALGIAGLVFALRRRRARPSEPAA